MIQSSWPGVTCSLAHTKQWQASVQENGCVAWQQSSPSPVAELFVLVEPNK